MDPGGNKEPQSLSWVIRIEERLNSRLAPNAKSSPTIAKVPSNWRGVHDNAFDPEMIRIGPFHKPRDQRHASRLEVMEDHKLRFLNSLLEGKLERWRSDGDMSRTTEGERVSHNHECKEDDDGGRIAKAVLLDDLVEAIRMLLEETRACYSVKSDDKYHRQRMNYINFDQELVVDGCFVVELLRLYYELLHTKIPAWAIEGDPILTNPQILATLRRDLLLFENQLPFFVLEKLYELINKKNNIDHQQAVPLEVLAVTFFNPLLPQQNAASKLDTTKSEARHLLEVFRSTFIKSVSEKVPKKEKNLVKSPSNSNGSIGGLVLHFASELQEAGVQFKKWKGHDLLDIEFSRGTLRVPPLSLNDNTICLLLNFVAYELSVNHPEPFFTNYFMFWDCLVNSPKDIQIFRKHGIINHLGSEEDVANLLIRCREVIYDLDLGYLCNEIKEVNEYCEQYYESKYSVWWRSLIRERFSSPWTCLSLFAAIILLLLTALQTFYTVYPYYWKH